MGELGVTQLFRVSLQRVELKGLCFVELSSFVSKRGTGTPFVPGDKTAERATRQGLAYVHGKWSMG